MEQPLNPSDRPSRLPPAIHVTVILLLLASFLSGVIIWYGETVNEEASDPTFPVNAWRTAHGLLNPFLCILFGYLLSQHIRYGWALRSNWFTGLLMELDFALLILTGVGLYYAPETWRSMTLDIHHYAGLALPLLLTWHWITSQLWVKKITK